MGFGVFDRRREFTCGIPGESGGAITERVAGGIVVVSFNNRAGDILQAIAGRGYCIRVIGAPV